MSLKILVIGDPHFKLSNSVATDIMLNEVHRVIEDRTPDLIVCLGDVLDRFAHKHVFPEERACLFLETLRSYAPTYVLVGNHDRESNDVFCTGVHSLIPMKRWSSEPHPLVVVDAPIHCVIKNMIFVFVPYVPNGRFLEALNLLPKEKDIPVWKKAKIIFAHQDFYGAVEKDKESDTGDKWDKTFPLVVSGHIHDYQVLGKNIIYIGAPLQHAFNESPTKSVSLFTASKTFLHEERIELTVPIYYTCEIKAEELDTFVLPRLPPKSEIKIKISGTFEELKAISKSTKIKNWRAKGIKVQEMPVIDPNLNTLKYAFVKKSFTTHLRELVGELPDLVSLLDSIISVS